MNKLNETNSLLISPIREYSLLFVLYHQWLFFHNQHPMIYLNKLLRLSHEVDPLF